MRIVFIGTVALSRASLERLINQKKEVAAVLTKEKSDFNSDFADLSEICKRNRITCRLVEDINSSDTVSFIKRINPDVIFCFGWSQLIKRESNCGL